MVCNSPSLSLSADHHLPIQAQVPQVPVSNTMTSEPNNEIQMIAKVKKLSSQSFSFANLTPSEKLELIEEMIQIVKQNNWSSTGNWLDKELALLKLIPSENANVESTTNDAGTRIISNKKNPPNYSSHAKNIKGLAQFSFGSVVLDNLETLRERFVNELRAHPQEPTKQPHEKVSSSSQGHWL